MYQVPEIQRWVGLRYLRSLQPVEGKGHGSFGEELTSQLGMPNIFRIPRFGGKGSDT